MEGENKMNNISQNHSVNQTDNGSAQVIKSERSRSRERDNGSAQLRKSERSRSRERDNGSAQLRKSERSRSRSRERDYYYYLSPPEKAESDVPPPPAARSSRSAFTDKVHLSPSISFRKSLNPDLTTTNVVNDTASIPPHCCSVQ